MNTDVHPVYLIDDDEAVRSALVFSLKTMGFDVRAFADGMAFLAGLPNLAPGCLIVDIRMPEISGLRLQEQLNEAGSHWPVIVISGHGDIEACRRAFRGGAVDFLSKPVEEDDLRGAVEKAIAQLTVLERRHAEAREARAILALLTRREKRILELISRGFTTRDIATGLVLSPRTVETHRSNLASKLGTTSPAEMARILIIAGDTP